ncbi:ATP-binding protein [Pseudonocardia sp.]|uniref:ATP-binding protein n=1 Tax=Pseudonocardia sp. TaxID=60912 RepID=UPI003D13146A
MRHRYRPDRESCVQVRRDMRAFLDRCRVDADVAENAMLIANELACNAVDHAHTPFSLTATLSPGRLRIELTDGSAEEPRLQPHDTTAVRGRGLQMVQHLSSSWSFRRDTVGKTVVVDVLLPAMHVPA